MLQEANSGQLFREIIKAEIDMDHNGPMTGVTVNGSNMVANCVMKLGSSLRAALGTALQEKILKLHMLSMWDNARGVELTITPSPSIRARTNELVSYKARSEPK